MLEVLERRRLMAAGVVISGSIATITGTNESNVITVDVLRDYVTVGFDMGKTGGFRLRTQYSVTIDGQQQTAFEAGEITQINILGLGGNDKITGPVSLPTLLNGPGTAATPGTSSVINEAIANVRIEGGSGRDRIVGGTGDDTLIGGRGDDVLIDQFGSDSLQGNAGRDSFYTLEGKSRFVLNGQSVYSTAGGADSITDGGGDDVPNVITSDTGDVITGVAATIFPVTGLTGPYRYTFTDKGDGAMEVRTIDLAAV